MPLLTYPVEVINDSVGSNGVSNSKLKLILYGAVLEVVASKSFLQYTRAYVLKIEGSKSVT